MASICSAARLFRVLASAAVAVGLSGCILDLERRIACGDGFVDEAQGEECDPGDPNSYRDACEATLWPLGEGDCDEETCQIIDDRQQCSVCGDGFLDRDAGEECDLADLGGAACPVGGVLMCKADCTLDDTNCERCGNGVVDDGEECDPRTGGFVTPQECSPALVTEQYPYISGATTSCKDDCTWDRSTCGYCGDGDRDIERPVAPGVTVTELCDGDDFDDARLDMLEPNNDCIGRDDLRVNAECGTNCNDYEIRDDPDVCCIKPGEICPEFTPGGGASSFKCCYEFSHPDETVFCQDRTTINDEGQLETSRRCK